MEKSMHIDKHLSDVVEGALGGLYLSEMLLVICGGLIYVCGVRGKVVM